MEGGHRRASPAFNAQSYQSDRADVRHLATRGSLRGSVRGIECYPAEQEAGENEGEIVVGEDGDATASGRYVSMIRRGHSILPTVGDMDGKRDEGLVVQEVPNVRCHGSVAKLGDCSWAARKLDRP